MVLIDTEEYQKLILNLMHSEEIDEMINATVYKDDERAKAAIRYGMAIASLYTCKCQRYKSAKELEDQLRIKTNMLKATESKVEELYEKLEENNKFIDAVQRAYNQVTERKVENDTAKWEEYDDSYRCSGCLYISKYDYYECPNCGKPMINGNEENNH